MLEKFLESGMFQEPVNAEEVLEDFLNPLERLEPTTTLDGSVVVDVFYRTHGTDPVITRGTALITNDEDFNDRLVKAAAEATGVGNVLLLGTTRHDESKTTEVRLLDRTGTVYLGNGPTTPEAVRQAFGAMLIQA